MTGQQTQTKTKTRVLVDDVRESPVDRELSRVRRAILGGLVLVALIVVVLIDLKARSVGSPRGSASAYAASAGMKP